MAESGASFRAAVHEMLRGEPEVLHRWLGEGGFWRVWMCVMVVGVAGAAYGFSIGCWRSPLQAAMTAVKFPLILLATTAGNVLLNGFLAPLAGADLSLRQTTLAILISQGVAAVVLAAFSPLVLFIIWNLPSMTREETRATAFCFLQVTQVGIIAFAGVTANTHLYRLMCAVCPNAEVAGRVIAAWLAGNLLLGTQLTWIFRPFFGSPYLEVQFLRPEAFRGNFFEYMAHAVAGLFS